MSTMYEDVCHTAEDQRVAMIILPFHKQWRRDGDNHEATEIVSQAWRGVNQRVLQTAPCSVAVLVDRGFANTGTQRICIVFFGGPDDREALELGGRMAEHPTIKLTVVKFVEKEGLESNGLMLKPSPSESTENSYSFSTAKMDRKKEKELDEEAVAEFRSKWDGKAECVEKVAANNIVEGVLAIGSSGDHDLLIVGKGRFPSRMVAELADRHAEHAELGPIGDILASSGHGVVSSVLVIQQHDVAHSVEAPVSKVVHGDCQRFVADESSSTVLEMSKESV